MQDAAATTIRNYDPIKKIPAWLGIGARFHKLEVTKILGRVGKRCFLQAKCDCGNNSIIEFYNLKSGRYKSCGCHRAETASKARTTHGLRRSREYGIWAAMKARCSNPKNKDYGIYGARGIRVCKEWESSFESFYKDMGKAPNDKFSIDRKDNALGYEPSNCRWASIIQQARNRRTNKIITFQGITGCYAEIESHFGLPAQFFTRINSNRKRRENRLAKKGGKQ